jgi:hypothetical protein
MSAQPSLTPRPVVNIAPDVEEFARSRGVESPLRRMVEATARLFPTARIEVFTEPDVALEDYVFLVFEVHARREDIPDHREARKRWGEEWLAAYPYPRQQPFVLSLRADPE